MEETQYMYQGKRHDYIYYSKNFIKNGKKYRHGYYDENHKYYKNVIFTNRKSHIICYACGSVYYDQINTKYNLYCPECGELIPISTCDTALKPPKNTESIQPYLIWIGGAIACVALILMLAFFGYNKILQKQQTKAEAQSITEQSPFIYVDELGREIKKIGYNTYYDEQSDCICKFNTEATPTQWQYYYNGISDRYGEYGWMVYNNYLNVWQINIGKQKWKILDEKDNTERLWHFTEVCRNYVE